MAGCESGFDVFSPGSAYIVLDAGGSITLFFLHPQNILAYISYSFYCFYFTSTKYSSLYFLRKTQLSIVLPDSGYFFNLYEINMSHVSHDKVCSTSRGKMRTDCFINVTIHYCTHIFTKSNDKVIYFFVYVDMISRQCSILSE